MIDMMAVKLIDFDEYYDGNNYDYSGNFIFTKDLVEREVAMESMC